jgi:hypothetical protein
MGMGSCSGTNQSTPHRGQCPATVSEEHHTHTCPVVCADGSSSGSSVPPLPSGCPCRESERSRCQCPWRLQAQAGEGESRGRHSSPWSWSWARPAAPATRLRVQSGRGASPVRSGAQSSRRSFPLGPAGGPGATESSRRGPASPPGLGSGGASTCAARLFAALRSARRRFLEDRLPGGSCGERARPAGEPSPGRA